MKKAIFLFYKDHEAVGGKLRRVGMRTGGCSRQEVEAWPRWEKSASRVEVAEDRRDKEGHVLACSSVAVRSTVTKTNLEREEGSPRLARYCASWREAKAGN